MSRTLQQKMADKHEADIVEAIGGRLVRGSGNQPGDKGDGKHDRYGEAGFAFCWDAKSTRGGTIPLTKKNWDKITEEAYDRRPMMPGRWYEDDHLREYTDVVTISLDDFIELLEAASG
jgi:hypothetical protein